MDEFRPYGAGIVPVPYQRFQLGHSFVAVFHQSPFVKGFSPNHGWQPPLKSLNSWPLATEGSHATSWLPWDDSVRRVVKMPGRSTERMPIEGKTVTSLLPSVTLSSGELGSPDAEAGTRRAREIDCARRVLSCRCTPAGRSRRRRCRTDTTARSLSAASRTPSTLTGLSPVSGWLPLLRASSPAAASRWWSTCRSGRRRAVGGNEVDAVHLDLEVRASRIAVTEVDVDPGAVVARSRSRPSWRPVYGPK